MASTRSAGSDIARALGVTLALLAGCGEPAEAPKVDAPSERGTFDGLEAAGRSLGYDPYAIGATWFEYDHATHALTPRFEVYVARRGEQLAIFELASYYDARGESGFFTVRGDSWDGAAWSGQVDFVTEVNVKDARTCLSLAPLAEVGCEAPDAALILRTSWRTVAEAGIAVKEPALLAKAHFSWPEDERTWLTALPEATLEDVARDADALVASSPLPNASWDPAASRVGWLHDAPGGAPRTDANLHVTANMQLAHWRVTELDGLSVTIEKRCQRASYTDQQPLPEATQTGTITLDEGSYTGKLVRLCDLQNTAADPAVVGTLDAAPAGEWPDTKTFDLIVEQLDGRVSVRPAPGHLLVNWTRRSGAKDFAPPTDMELLWKDYP